MTPLGKRLLAGAAALALAAAGALLLKSRLAPLALPQPSPALTAAAAGLDQVSIQAELLPEERRLEVLQTLTLTDRGEESRTELVLRTWPNAFQSVDTSPCAAEARYDSYYPDGFSSGSLVMKEARADLGNGEAAVAYRYTDSAKTVLSLPLPGTWQPGQRLTVTLRYTVELPRAAYRFGVWEDVYLLGNAFAQPALWEAGAYRQEEYGTVGEPFPSEVRNYTLKLTLPEGYACAATAYGMPQTENGKQVYHLQALAVRDFALAVSQRYQQRQTLQDGVLITVMASGQAKAQQALETAAQALRIYAKRYGAYPYQSLTVAEAPFAMDGMAYPGMVMLSSTLLAAGGRELETALAREVAHQWWYAVVGSDPVAQPWQDEALAQYSVLDYLEARYGAGERESWRQAYIDPSLRVTTPSDVSPGAPLSYFSTEGQYRLLAARRGAAMLCALDTMMEGGLYGFLSAYYARYAFQNATREDFAALLAQWSGEDYEPLMTDYLDTHIIP